jgi:hypothetical protein
VPYFLAGKANLLVGENRACFANQKVGFTKNRHFFVLDQKLQTENALFCVKPSNRRKIPIPITESIFL